MENIAQYTYDFIRDRLKYQNEANMTGGQNRKYSGETVEMVINKVIDRFKEKYPMLKIEIRGDDDKIKVKGKDGVSFTEESVDKHIYINGNLELIIECKTYLDKCYLQRASDDFRLIKKGVKRPLEAWIVSLENAVSDMAYNFFMYQDDNIYVNKCFFLSNGKRSSAKPIYKNYETRLNIDNIREMIKNFDNFLNNFI